MTARAGGLLLLAGLGLVTACARQGAPPGGERDTRPPVVIATTPEALAEVQNFEGRVRFDFDERISESVGGGSLDDAITISPRTGAVRVSHARRSLEVEMEGGFRPGLVYRVTLQPGVRDLFGNQTPDPFELVFSTGGEVEATTVAGEIWDRVTGQAVRGATLLAIGPDSLTYQASSDEQGIFAFRYLPGGTYELTGFVDQNRSGEPDRAELQGGRAIAPGAGDTLLVDVTLLLPDTTPAILLRAESLDSLTLVLEFDDYLDPAAPADGTEVELQADSAAAPRVVRLFQERAYADYVQAVSDSLSSLDSAEAAARAPSPDSAAAPPPTDTLANPADTLAVSTDTLTVPAGLKSAAEVGRPAVPARRGPPRLDGIRPAAASAGRPPLPGRRLVALLLTPGVPGVEYRVLARGVVNINGAGEGGGETTYLRAIPPAGPDSLSTAADTLGATGDTASWWEALLRLERSRR